ACYSLSFSLRFLCPAWPERIPRRPSPVENIELYPLFSTFGLLLRPIENNGLAFFVLFARSDESIVSPRLSKTSENTFYKHTKIAFIRRISNFRPNKITRFRKFFHRTHHFQPFSAVLTTSKKSPGKVSGNFKAVRTNFIHHALFTTASTIGKNTLPEIDPLVPGVILRIESAG
uniref:hypothetical protein n=1 Tax=Alistipes putredinis TaxID=28117 RepID=UPI003FD79A9A